MNFHEQAAITDVIDSSGSLKLCIQSITAESVPDSMIMLINASDTVLLADNPICYDPLNNVQIRCYDEIGQQCVIDLQSWIMGFTIVDESFRPSIPFSSQNFDADRR